MPYVSAAGVEVHYVERGPAEGPTLVSLHGFPVDHRQNLGTFEPVFAGRPGWRRLYLDFPGMGRTHAPDWLDSTDEVFRVTSAALDALVPGRYAVAGVSFGGYIAMGLAAAAPARVTGMALVAPMIVGPYDRRAVPPHEVRFREPGVSGSAGFEELAVVVTAEIVRRVAAEIEVGLAAADPLAIAAIEAHYEGSFPLLPPSGRYEGPALVLTGRQDSVTGFEDPWRQAGRWPRATFVILDRAGHNLSLEQVPLFDALVGEWLDRVEST
jgi:pimeloyl-ACP methyl ester carboxylesterase